MLEIVEGRLCLLDVLDVSEVMRCVRHIGLELWGSGGALLACKRESIKVWSFWSSTVALRECRYRGMERWSSGAALQARISGGMRLWSRTVGLAIWTYEGVERWSSGDALQVS